VTIDFALSNSVDAVNAGLFVSPGQGIHPTRVIDSYELIFVMQGCFECFEDGSDFHVRSGQSLLLFPGHVHGSRVPYPPDLRFYWVHFRLNEARGPGPDVAIPRLVKARDPETLSEIFCRFISDQESATLDPVGSSHLVALMLCEVFESSREESLSALSPAQVPLVLAIEAHIEANYMKPISTCTIAGELGLSPDYLERVYHLHRGRSILQALHTRRIETARALLRNDGRKNINEIAFECGYSCRSCFRRMFERQTGLSPRDFRSLYSRTHINSH